MRHPRWQLRMLMVGLVVFPLLIMSASGAAAAPAARGTQLPLRDALVEGPVQPTFAVPGYFSVTFGQTAGDALVDIPSMNTTAAVSGLQIGETVTWNVIDLKQQRPVRTDTFALSDMRAVIGGPALGYATDASARIEVYPSRAFSAKGKLMFRYDSLNRYAGFVLQDASLDVPTWPVGVVASGINSSAEALTIEKAVVSFPGADTSIAVEGYQLKDGQSTWKALWVAQGKSTVMKFGDVAAISGVELRTSSPSAGSVTTAAADIKVDVPNAVRASGRVVGLTGPQATGVGLVNGSMTLGGSGYTVSAMGMNSIQSGVKIDTVTIAAQPLDLEAILRNVTVGGNDGFAFDQALVKYTPSQGGGFEMVLTKSQQGYVMTTKSVIPVATGR